MVLLKGLVMMMWKSKMLDLTHGVLIISVIGFCSKIIDNHDTESCKDHQEYDNIICLDFF